MRAVNLYHRINFFAKTTSRDEYGATTDTWDYRNPTISTRGGIRYLGGTKVLENDEKFYTKSMELTVRYQSSIVETMRVQLDDTLDLYSISYIETIGRKEGLRLTLQKLDDGLTGVLIDPPTNLLVTADLEDYNEMHLLWINNDDEDGVLIERSADGSIWNQVARINKATPAVDSWTDDNCEELTQYFYRVRHFRNKSYSTYGTIAWDTTVEIPSNIVILSCDFDQEAYESGETVTATVTVRNDGATGTDLLSWSVTEDEFGEIYSNTQETGIVARDATAEVLIVFDHDAELEPEDEEQETITSIFAVECTLTSISSIEEELVLSSRGWTPQSLGLDLWAKSRDGITLVDEYENNPTILLPFIRTNGSDVHTDTGITAVANTVWVVKGRMITNTANRWQGAQLTGQNVRFFFGTGTLNNTINFAWGDTSVVAGNNKAHDFGWHVFIMYDKRLWVLSPDTLLTDESILNAIATESPLINLSTASWSGTPANIQYGRIVVPAYVSFEFGSSFIGTITAGAITWQRKHIMGGAGAYSYDILDKTNLVTWTNGSKNVKGFSSYGSRHFMDVGYSLYKNAEFRMLVPYLESGEAISEPTVAAGFTLAKNISDERLFIPDCKIRFLNDFFDRSDVTIYSDNARDETYYDSTNPKDWNGFELYSPNLYEFYNEDYRYRHFEKYNELAEINYPTEILLSTAVVAGANKSKMFNYCNDWGVEISLSQLTRHIDHQNGIKLFGFDATAGEIFYSSNNGGSYTTKEFVDAENIGMSFVFNNGNILFATDEKIYVSTDGLQSWAEVDITDQNGGPFPVVEGVKNFVNVRYIDSQILGNGKQLMTWGSYINVDGNNGYVCLFYSINGESVKTAYMFGQNATYGSYGDPTNTVLARHIHSSVFSADASKWYWNTGDAGVDPDFENHYYESEYDYLTDIWSHTKLLSGDASTQVKAGAFFYYNGSIYLGSDSTSGGASTRGVFKVAEAGLNALANQSRIFTDNGGLMSGLCVGLKMKIIFPGGNAYNEGKYRIVVFRERQIENPYSFVYWATDFEYDPEQTEPDTFVGWRLNRVSDTKVLCNVMNLNTLKYIYNTLEVNLV